MLKLKNTTLVTIDGLGENENHLKALKYSCQDIEFGEVIFFSNCNFGKNNFYKHVSIPKLSYNDYNKFCLTELDSYVNTEFVIIVQDDGFIIHPNNWNNEFQNYDYIGAPWPKDHMFFNTQRWPYVHTKLVESNREYHVGNGGFCMRSKKLMEQVKTLYNSSFEGIPEDVLIGVGLRKELENKNILFAPFLLARLFSCETMNVENMISTPNDTFGFHGRETHWAEVSKLNSIQL
jgi:hypothetical protein